MIDKKNIHTLLRDLDSLLSQKSEKREFTIFGSGALILQNITRDDRGTIDIDMVEPAIDMTLQLIAADAGEKIGMNLSWLNSAGNIFSRNFPKGWRERTKIVFRGDSLVVRSLGRKDLVATKFNAYCSRNSVTDFNDLVDLAPTKAELNFSKKWILSLDNAPDEKHIDGQISNILGKKKR